MATLSYVNVFAADIFALSGFSAPDAHGLLNLGEHATPTGVKFLPNIDVDSTAGGERSTPVAVAAGATTIKPPSRAYCDWYQAVLLDPEQNVFRINRMLS